MITPSEAKQIRRSLGLSQKEVSSQTSLCNTDISKFECGKLIMKSSDLRNLSNFYKEQMSSHSLLPSQEENTAETQEPISEPNQVNGILVPEGFDLDEAMDLMETYQDNQKNITAALKIDVERGFLGGINMDSILRDVLVPMAHNYSIINLIQSGHEIPALENPESKYLSEEENINTLEDVLNHLFSTPYAKA